MLFGGGGAVYLINLLTSFHSLFFTIRQVLGKYRPLHLPSKLISLNGSDSESQSKFAS